MFKDLMHAMVDYEQIFSTNEFNAVEKSEKVVLLGRLSDKKAEITDSEGFLATTQGEIRTTGAIEGGGAIIPKVGDKVFFGGITKKIVEVEKVRNFRQQIRP